MTKPTLEKQEGLKDTETGSTISQYEIITAMGKHYIEEHPYMPRPNIPYKFNLRQRCKDFVDRQLWQSVLIKRENPAINTQLAETSEEGEWVKHTWRLM